MIRATATTKSGRKLVLLGLEAKNIELLKEGKPMFIRGDEYGLDLDFDVTIIYGDTAEDIIRLLKDAGVTGLDNVDPSVQRG